MQNDCFPEAATEWSKAFVGRLADVNPRYRVKKGRDYPFIEMAAVGENFRGILSLDSRMLEGSGLSRFRVGDTLFAKITPCPENGKVAFVSYLPDDVGLGSTEFIVLSPRPGIDPRFLYHLACSHPVRGRAAARMEGSTGRQRVPEEVFTRRLLVPIPNSFEQAAIARILDAVDTALERTRAAVDRARELRRGLLQAAFEFVNSQEPEQDSDSGRIPRSWDAIKSKQAFVIVTGGCSSVDALRLPRDGETPDSWFMKVDDFNALANRRTIVQTKLGFREADNRLFKVLPPGTLVIAKRGAAILKNRVRMTAVPVALDPNLMALQVLPGMRAEFLRYQLEWRNLSRYVEDSGVPQLNNKDLYPRYFLRAPDDRQREIIETVGAAEVLEHALIAKCDAFEALKKSLMYDLFTGRVRVSNEAKAAAS
ncbi:restriction endonuclease subunit S [Candidatus Methylomirabilis sp.]|uniref:restriction endonuclease subunit S n=1 Tax=Candidatus Methylomirabilis sp. TaxID=2032687 RepID=UPI002A60E8D6|nr:restriction endonuclease subunit S [Candidatus Methylomirabilis sp.]